ncbi:MAG TPA: GNAT family protein, partial [Planococcus sp. (in: firmicutes)]|nr:GNAT family protein [Planococcus sp. (in: firmicutes)]
KFFENSSMTRYSDFYTLLIQEEIITRAAMLKENDQGYYFGIFKNDSGELVGLISLFHISRGALQNAFLGYAMDEQHNNKGYTTEAVNLAVNFAFQKLELHRIEAGVMPRNTASIRVLEKAGFHKEGIAIKSVQINGKWEDHQVMAIINPKDL